VGGGWPTSRHSSLLSERTLPFGTPEEVRQEVCARLKIFGRSGGYVFNPTHNVQARVPVENVLAMYQAVREFGKYPL
jgi:uroporphyrinogen-III decarboxylase